MIAMVVAMAKGNVIGAKDDLPWYLPADLRRFKEITTGHTVIMGRTTFESIVARLGKPLPNRRSIVLTKNSSYSAVGAETAADLSTALASDTDVYVIGGGQIFDAALSRTDRLYVTEVHADIKGDTYFPEIDPAIWKELSREPHIADDVNPYDYDFVMYERR